MMKGEEVKACEGLVTLVNCILREVPAGTAPLIDMFPYEELETEQESSPFVLLHPPILIYWGKVMPM